MVLPIVLIIELLKKVSLIKVDVFLNDLKKTVAEAVNIRIVIIISRKLSFARCSILSLTMLRLLRMKSMTTKVRKKWDTVTIPRTML